MKVLENTFQILVRTKLNINYGKKKNHLGKQSLGILRITLSDFKITETLVTEVRICYFQDISLNLSKFIAAIQIQQVLHSCGGIKQTWLRLIER